MVAVRLERFTHGRSRTTRRGDHRIARWWTPFRLRRGNQEARGAEAVSQCLSFVLLGNRGLEHFCDVFTRGHADAALAASIFHYADTSVSELKRYLREHNIPVRM